MKKTLLYLLIALLLFCPCALALEKEVTKPEEMTIEDKAKYGEYPAWGVPSEGDISEEEALAIVKQSLRDDYGLTDEEIDRYEIYPYFYIEDVVFTQEEDGESGSIRAPFYQFRFRKIVIDEVDYYMFNDFAFAVASKTGEILYVSDDRDRPPLSCPIEWIQQP